MGALISFSGALRSGKDAAADHLVVKHGFAKLGMSDVLNGAMLLIDPIVYSNRYGDSIRYSSIVNQIGYTEAKKHPEVRRLLQVLGTEVGRNMLGENIWVDAMRRKISALLDEGEDVVLTGVRFPNELEMICDLYGVPVWIERPVEGDKPEYTKHASENSLSAGDFDHEITNGGTLEELYKSVDELLEAVYG